MVKSHDGSEFVRLVLKLRRRLLAGMSIAAAMSPVAAWLFFKPIRVVAPELNGSHCAGPVCVEDPATSSFAATLHRGALENIAARLRPLRAPPRTIFCSTQQCYRSFAGRGRGIAVLNFGVVIAPQSWQPYIVEHEFIQMLQAQKLGSLRREAAFLGSQSHQET